MAKTLTDRQAQIRRDGGKPLARHSVPWARWALVLNALFTYIFLYAPIVLLILYSFNNSRSGARWQGFTLRWYQRLVENERLRDALWTSLSVASISTIVATVLGTLAALALAKPRWRGRRTFDVALYLPVIVPDIVLAIAMLGFFALAFRGFQDLTGINLNTGLTTVIIAHIAFNISYVAVVVRASLAHFDPRMDEAAADLGATPFQTFWRIKFPLILPGILGGALLAFTLSLDDFVVTFFARGPGVNTLTTEVYGQIRKNISPEINAISTVMVLMSMILVALSLVLQRRQNAK